MGYGIADLSQSPKPFNLPKIFQKDFTHSEFISRTFFIKMGGGWGGLSVFTRTELREVFFTEKICEKKI